MTGTSEYRLTSQQGSLIATVRDNIEGIAKYQRIRLHILLSPNNKQDMQCTYNTTLRRVRANILLLILLALQPTMGFSLLSDFLPFRPFLTHFSPPSYSHRLDIFLNVFNPSFPWSSSYSPTHWLPF